MGGFSTAFDLISSEYGWSDEKILDLTLARMQQIVAAITVRKSQAIRDRKLEVSWHVRTLASFIAAGYMTEDTAGLDAANSLTIDDIERQIMESDLPEPPKEARSGSTETLMRAFGGM